MIHLLLEQRLRAAVAAALPEANLANIFVRPCPDPKFGDYQCTSLMSIAKERKMNPRQLATDVLAKLDVTSWCDTVDIAGAGFLNFRVKRAAITEVVRGAARGEHLFYQPAARPQTIVIDFSSPNVAKPMHIGHIRSTVLGDAIARMARLLGHRVITDNHIGDWGTQFGMLLVGWKTRLDRVKFAADPLQELERIYKEISGECDPDKPQFNAATREAARHELVKLQQGDPENQGIWQEMIRVSQSQFDSIYGRLGVKFDHVLGESFYNPRLAATVQDLERCGLAQVTEGAKAILSDGTLPPKSDPFLVQRDGKWVTNPFIVQKQDGGFNYATTDLATLMYRYETWKPDVIAYVTDGRQQQHFNQLFATFRRWHPEVAQTMRLAHVWFGSIQGEDGRPLKTRDGSNVKLADVLDEAIKRALVVVNEKNPELPEATRQNIAEVVGLGAVKYADLLPNRQTDYQFSWDKMLSLQGNTAPYLQYAYARIQSILRKASAQDRVGELQLAAPEEFALAERLLNFGLMLETVLEEFRPNLLCNYLYEVAGLFARFYESCPVLKSEDAVRASRLALCDVTGKVLRTGLDVLGIKTLDQM